MIKNHRKRTNPLQASYAEEYTDSTKQPAPEETDLNKDELLDEIETVDQYENEDDRDESLHPGEAVNENYVFQDSNEEQDEPETIPKLANEPKNKTFIPQSVQKKPIIPFKQGKVVPSLDSTELKGSPPEFDLSDFLPSTSIQKHSSYRTAGDLTLVNTPKNGKRLRLSKNCAEQLEYPDSIQVLFAPGQFVIGKDIADVDSPHYKVNHTEASGYNIYAGGLVDEITAKLNLDFRGRTSITFENVSYAFSGRHPIAVVKVNVE